MFDGARFTSGPKIPGGLRVTVTRAACPAEKLADSASHDPNDNRRHAALHRSRVGNRHLFRFHTALSAKNLAIDRDGVGLPLQQDCSCDCGNPARCRDLGNARDLSGRISFWWLGLTAAPRSAVHFRQVGLRDYVHWHVFSRVVWPTFWPAFVGSLFLAIPSAIIIYFVLRLLVSRARMPQKVG